MNTLKALKNLVCALVLFAPLTNAGAAFINPDPATFHNDNGAKLFAHAFQTLSVQLSNPLSATFGFYFAGNPGNKITIFDATDSAAGNIALIDFSVGAVGDVDANILQSVFTPSLANIGFFLTLGSTTLYSEAALNPLGLDVVGTFSQITQPLTYLLVFEVPNASGGVTTLAAQIVSPLLSVPEPSGLWLIVIGLLAFWGAKRSCIRKSAG